jgi:hypothetical protein
MFPRAFFFLIIALITTSHRAFADAPKMTVSFAQGVSFPIGLSEPFGASPSISEGVRVSRGIGNGSWSWMGEAGFGTSFTAFTPSFYATTGPAQALSKAFLIGEGISWKYMPGYDDTPSSHALGAVFAPVFRVSFGSVLLPIGFACTINNEPVCSMSFGAKFLIKLNNQ